MTRKPTLCFIFTSNTTFTKKDKPKCFSILQKKHGSDNSLGNTALVEIIALRESLNYLPAEFYYQRHRPDDPDL